MEAPITRQRRRRGGGTGGREAGVWSAQKHEDTVRKNCWKTTTNKLQNLKLKWTNLCGFSRTRSERRTVWESGGDLFLADTAEVRSFLSGSLGISSSCHLYVSFIMEALKNKTFIFMYLFIHLHHFNQQLTSHSPFVIEFLSFNCIMFFLIWFCYNYLCIYFVTFVLFYFIFNSVSIL